MKPVYAKDVQIEVDAHGVTHSYVKGALARRMFLLFAVAYVLSYGFRAINAVIAQPLVQDLQLSSGQLGFLASAYFLSFALMQLPVGVMLDRYGPRRVESVLLAFAVLGAVIFATAQSYLWLWVGRALIGVGVSACLMAAVKAYSLYFRPHMQATLSSWMLVAGSLGALTVTTPVEYVLPMVGWRGVFFIAALCCAIAALALWFALPALFKPSKHETLPEMAQGYGQIFRHPHFWRVVPLATFIQGGFMAFNGLWIGPWFTEVVGWSNAQAAVGLFWISGVLMLSYLVLGFLTRRVTRAGGDEDAIMVWGLGISMPIFAIQLILGQHAPLWIWLVHAMTVATGIMTYSTCNKPFPKHLTGRSSTALNLAIFVGAFSVQWGIGLLIDLFLSSGFSRGSSMQMSLTVLLALQIASWAWFARPGRKTSHLNGL